MRTVGLDLAIKGRHQAVVLDAQGHPVGRSWRLDPTPTELDDLLTRARQGGEDTMPVRVILEPTGSSWMPVASYLDQQGVTVYMVSTQQAAALHKVYRQHAKSDRISARVLARLPWVTPEHLHPLTLLPAAYVSGRRWCRQQETLAQNMTAIKNRVQAWERAFWPGLEAVVGNPFTGWMRRWRQEWYDPWRLHQVELATLEQFLTTAGADAASSAEIARGLRTVATRVVTLFGLTAEGSSPYVDYAVLHDQIQHEMQLLETYQEQHTHIRRQVHTLYRQLQPARQLESIPGVGPAGAAVYTFFVGDITRFRTAKEFRSWSGLIPGSAQSGVTARKGVRITQAGPALIKKYAYLNADVARQWDPQLAALYYDQMVHKGRHHTQAVCACATHLLNRIRAVLRDGRPYELRDVAGTPVSKKQARELIVTQYHVPEAVRRQRRQRERREREAQRTERRYQPHHHAQP